jgi:hypothetical protein
VIAESAKDGTTHGLPPTGLAFIDTAGKWCATFATDSLPPAERMMIVFPDSGSTVPALRARLLARRSSPCAAAFPQQSLADLAAYDVQILDSLPSNAERPGSVGVAVLSDVVWKRGPDGVVRADLDRDGHPEEVSACAIGEGQSFTLWSRDSAGVRQKLWRGYFDWGALVDETCAAGEAE